MNKSILVIDTPSSCSECTVKTKTYDSFAGFYWWQCPFVRFRNKSHQEEYSDKCDPNCPLISINIEELESAFNNIAKYGKYMEDENEDNFVIIQSTIDKLKGVK